MMRRFIWILALAACDDGITDPEDTVLSVSLGTTRVEMVTGTSTELTALVLGLNTEVLHDVRVAWSSTAPEVATVSATGTVTAVNAGTTLITAAAGGKSASVIIAVRRPVAQLFLTPNEFDLVVGEEQLIDVRLADASGGTVTNVIPTWSVTDSSVATVSSRGANARLVGKAVGTIELTATAEGASITRTVLVGPALNVDGLWDWIEERAEPGTVNTCTDTGSVTFTAAGWDDEDYYTGPLYGGSQRRGACMQGALRFPSAGLGIVTDLSVGVRTVAFTMTDDVSCRYEGTATAATTIINGTVVCGTYTGTWQAHRALPIASIEIELRTPGDSLLRGTTDVRSAQLINSLGRAAYLRDVTWETEDPSIVSLGDPPYRQATRLTGNNEGTTTVTARAAGVSASFSATVFALAFTNVSVGTRTTCATTATSAIYCWDQSAKPTRRFAGPALPLLDVGVQQHCGLDTNGFARCWFGDDATTGLGTVQRIASDLAFTTLSTGGHYLFDYYYWSYAPRPHVCGLVGDGQAYCWGEDGSGQRGDGAATAPFYTPASVSTALRFKSISAGGMHTCALSTTDRAYCWGANTAAQLGVPLPIVGSNAPVAVSGDLSFASVSAGHAHTCALTTTGAAWCWGDNYNGATGPVGPASFREAPDMVSESLTFTQLALGYVHSCGLTTGGEVYCWGGNYNGQLGTTAIGGFSAIPTRLPGTQTFTKIVSGADAFHTCGMATDARVYCWGYVNATGTGTSAVAPVIGQR
jgi:hypothetical protein